MMIAEKLVEICADNDINFIFKSKGTEKAFRNFFRSIGIGQDVVKLKMYADNSTFVLRNNYEFKSFERRFLRLARSSGTNLC